MFYGGIQVELCLLLYQSHVINKQHSNDWLLISRFTKQFPSNDFYKHFICFKLLITLYIFSVHYLSNLFITVFQTNVSLYSNCFIKLMPSNGFIDWHQVDLSLKLIFMFQMFYQTYLCFYITNCMPIYV